VNCLTLLEQTHVRVAAPAGYGRTSCGMSVPAEFAGPEMFAPAGQATCDRCSKGADSMAVDEITARVGITQLLDEFFARLDRAESVAELLTADAQFRDTRGRAEVAELLLSLAKKRADTGRVSRHITSNVSIQSQGERLYRVRSQAFVLSLNTRPGRSGELAAIDHDDLVELGPDGVFRFARRSMTDAFRYGLTLEDGQ
jgi:SnoaL-like protein